MRTSICLGIALVAGFAQFAAAQDAGTGPAPTAEQRAAATKLLKLELIQKRLEAAGLKDVRVSPEVHVVQAQGPDGKPVVLAVDPETMIAIPLMIPGEPSTTGSGSEDEGEEKL
jgi:hypothetical protein